MAEIEVYLNHPIAKIALLPIKKTALKVLCTEKSSKKSVLIALTDNKSVKILNKRWRGKNKATDVLSFSYNEPDFLGEVIISLDKASTQASEYKISFEDEVRRLVVHGLLHLLGHRHHKKVDRMAMEKKEEKYLKIRK
jgi:probable rRNA maturation factor